MPEWTHFDENGRRPYGGRDRKKSHDPYGPRRWEGLLVGSEEVTFLPSQAMRSKKENVLTVAQVART